MKLNLPINSLKDIIILILILFFLIVLAVFLIGPEISKMLAMLSYYVNNFVNLILH